MYKLNKNKAPLTFNKLIKKPFPKYPKKFSENCFSLKAISLSLQNAAFLSTVQNLEYIFNKGREGIIIVFNF